MNASATKLLPRQHASELVSVSFAVSVPGCGWRFWGVEVEVEVEFENHTDEVTAFISSHSLWPPSFCLSCEFWPPTIDEGRPGGVAFC